MTRSTADALHADTVRQVLADILGLPVDTLVHHAQANLFELGLDSLGVVRFITDIEQSLRIQLDTQELHADLFEDLSRLIDHIDTQARTAA